MTTQEAAGDLQQQLQQLIKDSHQEYERVQKELREIEMLIHQSSDEVDKLAQRNVQMSTRVRQMEMSLDTYPRSEIRAIYNAAQEAQMRLFMMRGQVEQLQSKRESLERLAHHLQRLLEVLESFSQVDLFIGKRPVSPSLPMMVRIIEAQENERQQLTRQMHDGPAQALTNLILQAEICERLFDTDPNRARAELSNLKNAATSTFQQIRNFIFDLRPMMLDDLGLVPTLRRYVDAFEKKTNLPVQLTIMGEERRLPSYIEVVTYRIIQELLNNIDQHAHASHVRVTLDLQKDEVTASVEDDGSGFDVGAVLAATHPRKPFGIPTMRQQVEMLGGKLEFESSIGRGTKVRLSIPIRLS